MFPSDTDFDTEVTLETEAVPIVEDIPFHILLLGDWSGKESRSIQSDLSKLNPIEIDRDNFEEVMKNLQIGIELNFQSDSENVLSLQFAELDDFHPDKIFQQTPLFTNLRDIRRRLSNSQTFDAAAKEVRSWFDKTENVTEGHTHDSQINQPTPDNLLDQILDRNDENLSSIPTQTKETSELSLLIKNIVKPHLIQTDTAEQSKLLMVVDEVISDLMRNILHHPQFQAMESAWRSIFFLIKRIETDNELKFFLLDIGKNNLALNLKSVDNLSDSKLYQILIKEVVEHSVNKPWAVICGNYTFELNIDDTATLIRLAKIAYIANAPFISYIKPEIFGFTSFASAPKSVNWQFSENSSESQLWTALRTVSETTHLGLMLPRFLGRLPYGEKTDPTETFYFEEFTSFGEHEQFLWSNPSFVCALLLAQSYREYGWNMAQSFVQDLDALPIYLYQEGNETKTMPCAEIVMTQNNCETILEQGLVPLISFRNTDKIRLGRFQSINFPAETLGGRWK